MSKYCKYFDPKHESEKHRVGCCGICKNFDYEQSICKKVKLVKEWIKNQKNV